MTNYQEVAYALSIDTKVDDFGWPWSAISSNFLGILRYSAFSSEQMFVVDGVTVKNASEEWFSELCPIYQGCRALSFALAGFLVIDRMPRRQHQITELKADDPRVNPVKGCTVVDSVRRVHYTAYDTARSAIIRSSSQV